MGHDFKRSRADPYRSGRGGWEFQAPSNDFYSSQRERRVSHYRDDHASSLDRNRGQHSYEMGCVQGSGRPTSSSSSSCYSQMSSRKGEHRSRRDESDIDASGRERRYSDMRDPVYTGGEKGILSGSGDSRRRPTLKRRRSVSLSSRRSTSNISDGRPRDDSEIRESGCDGDGRRYRREESNDSGELLSSTVIIKGVPDDHSEDQIEERVRSVAISKGFSTPNAVNITRATREEVNYQSPSHSKLSSAEAKPLLNSAGSITIAFVDFPSSDAANKFRRSCRHDIFIISNRCCPVSLALVGPEAAESKDARLRRDGTSPQFIEEMGDWKCRQCNFLNFAIRGICASCTAPKQLSALEAGRERNSEEVGTLISAGEGGWGIEGVENASQSLVVMDFLTVDIESVLRIIRRTTRKNTGTAIEPQHVLHVVDSESPRPSTFCVLRFLNSKATLDVWRCISSLGYCEIGGKNCSLRCWILSRREKQSLQEMLKVIGKSCDDKDSRSRRVDEKPIVTIEMDDLAQVAKSSPVWEPLLLRCEGVLLPLSNNLPPPLHSCDKTSGYYFDPALDLYFDPSSSYYMNSNGDYYVHDTSASALRRVCSYAEQNKSTSETAGARDQKEIHNSGARDGKKYDATTQSSTNVVASLLAAAQKSAQATKEAIEKAKVKLEMKSRSIAINPASRLLREAIPVDTKLNESSVSTVRQSGSILDVQGKSPSWNASRGLTAEPASVAPTTSKSINNSPSQVSTVHRVAVASPSPTTQLSNAFLQSAPSDVITGVTRVFERNLSTAAEEVRIHSTVEEGVDSSAEAVAPPEECTDPPEPPSYCFVCQNKYLRSQVNF